MLQVKGRFLCKLRDTDVTDAFRMYLRPLLGSDMPDTHCLGNNPVAKVLRP